MRWLREFLLMPQPPFLGKEGQKLRLNGSQRWATTPLRGYAFNCSSNAEISVTGCLQLKFSQTYAVGLPSIIVRSWSKAILPAGPPATTARGRYRPRNTVRNASGFPTIAISFVGPT